MLHVCDNLKIQYLHETIKFFEGNKSGDFNERTSHAQILTNQKDATYKNDKLHCVLKADYERSCRNFENKLMSFPVILDLLYTHRRQYKFAKYFVSTIISQLFTTEE